MKVELVAWVSVGLATAAVAWSVFAPNVSIRRPANEAVPFPADVPMSTVAVPWSVPVPEAMETVTLRLVARPVVESLPKASWVFTTGWMPNAAPAVAEPGCVVKASVVAVSAVTAIDDCDPVTEAVTVSVADKVFVPPATVLKVALNVPVPAKSVLLMGRTTCASFDAVSATVPA